MRGKSASTECNLPFGIRLSQENVSHYGNILGLPLYMAGMVPEKIDMDVVKVPESKKNE